MNWHSTGTRAGSPLLRCVLMLIVALAVAAVLSVSPAYAQGPGQPPKIAPKVLSDLQTQGKATFFVVMKEQADTSFAASISDWNQRGQAVVDALQAVANRTQPSVLARAAIAGAEATPFWIVNAVKMTSSDAQLVQELAGRSDVDYIRAEDTWTLPEPLPGTQEPQILAVEWNIARIHAPEVWQQFGSRGEDIVVANIDTGVQFNHPALVQQYRGRRADGTFDHNYNWFDPSRICGNPSLTPCDNVGHGTHTMGTMVGDDGGQNQIGVAPRAKWIAAKGCESGSCSLTALLASGQWVLAPTDLNSQNPRPDLRPHVVNNSWGDGTGDPFYRATVQNWRNAGIFPAFANGNPGPACGAASVPGVYPESFGVGATDINDNIAGFSGRGPANAFGGITKPNASAPGVNVRSSVPTNNYANFSGTSMATPHVAGAVALIWSARPSLKGDIAKTFDVLQKTARPRLDAQCGPAGPPNNVYGWGIMDVLEVIRSITPIRAEPDRAETCRPAAATTTIRVFGGPGLFQNNVNLSLMSVTPAPPAGAEITAGFNPNPVPLPPPQGSASVMTMNATEATPPNAYILTVKGSDGVRSDNTDVTLLVRSQIPIDPDLLGPLDGSEDILETPTFSWSRPDQTTQFRLQVFSGAGCAGTPIRDFDNITGNAFTVPAAQALPFFQTFSWTVAAKNSCGVSAAAQCSSFATRSCVATPHEVVANGGFEQDLTNWVIDASTPRPLAILEQKRSGLKSLRLGVIGESGTPTQAGDSEVHQTITIPATALAPKLSFWFFGQSADTLANDQQEVFVVPTNPPGPAVSLMREVNNARTFLNRTFSLNAFVGKTIEIHFRVRNDGNTLPTGMLLDDVSVTFISCGGPDFFLAAAAPTFNEVCGGNSINFTVGVQSLNGPNFATPVLLSAANLPPGTSVSFASNPLLPGSSTTMTLTTARPAASGRIFLSVVGEAVTAPPFEPRATTIDTLISANPPGTPEQITPLDGQLNVPRRPTLSWTEPFVPDAPAAASSPTPTDVGILQASNLPPESLPLAQADTGITAFGAARYRVQVARDSAFATPLAEGETTDTSFTVGVDLDIVTQHFWRVNATNACGTSAFSIPGSFVTGACFEAWAVNPPFPLANAPSQPSVVAAAGKIYVIGGGVGPGPDTRTNQVFEFDPATNVWTRKADVPAPGPGSNFGSAAELGGKIYVFGGVSGPPGPVTILSTLWIYEVATNNWRRGRDLPSPNFGTAVAAVGSKIILATGSGFGLQTWEYDPAADIYTRKADAPPVPAPFRMHGAAIGNEMHAFAGGFGGNAHIVYNAASDTWRTARAMPFGVTDPAVAALGGKFYVVGGRPIARTQVFDPTTNTWSQGPPVTGLPNGVDNTDGDVIGFKFYLVGGFDGTNGTNAHRVFTLCGAGSAQLFAYVADGDGTTAGIPNERSDLVLSNDLGGSASATVMFHMPDGTLDSSRTFALGPRETKTLTDVIRQVRGANGVQNVSGSLAVFATQSIDALASVSQNRTNDLSIADGQTLSGTRNGFVPVIQLNSLLHTQVALHNASSVRADVQLLAYPPEGGDVPIASASANIPPRGLLDFPDIVSALGLSAGYSGQLRWNSTQPLVAFARHVTSDDGYSGAVPARSTSDGSNTILVAYVEDTEAFSSHLQINNTGLFTAGVTVRFVDTSDTTGGTPGDSSSRDIPVPVNSATTIPNVIRWVLGSASPIPLGKVGFLVISSPQTINALAALGNNVSSDPATSDSVVAAQNSFTPIIVAGRSRVAIANAGTAAANVSLMAFNADGAPALATPFRLAVVGAGQFFTEDITTALGLPATFSGSLTIASDAPVVVFNQLMTENNGSVVVPVHPR